MFRIGEFSKIAQVSGRLLRYYDEVGLLKPIRIDPETGYRYYSTSQLPQLNRILALKELGLSLDQIARLLGGKISTDEIRGMLLMSKAQLEQHLREDMLRIRYIESRIDQIDREGQLRVDDVKLKSVPAQEFIGVQERATTLTDCRRSAREMELILGANLKSSMVGNFIVVLRSELFDLDNLDVDMGFLIHGKPKVSLTLLNGERLAYKCKMQSFLSMPRTREISYRTTAQHKTTARG